MIGGCETRLSSTEVSICKLGRSTPGTSRIGRIKRVELSFFSYCPFVREIDVLGRV